MRYGVYEATHIYISGRLGEDVSQDLLCWHRERPDQMRASRRPCPTTTTGGRAALYKGVGEGGLWGAGINASTHQHKYYTSQAVHVHGM